MASSRLASTWTCRACVWDPAPPMQMRSAACGRSGSGTTAELVRWGLLLNRSWSARGSCLLARPLACSCNAWTSFAADRRLARASRSSAAARLSVASLSSLLMKQSCAWRGCMCWSLPSVRMLCSSTQHFGQTLPGILPSTRTAGGQDQRSHPPCKAGSSPASFEAEPAGAAKGWALSRLASHQDGGCQVLRHLQHLPCGLWSPRVPHHGRPDSGLRYSAAGAEPCAAQATASRHVPDKRAAGLRCYERRS